MTARACALIAGLALLAAACSSSDMESTAFTGGATASAGDTPEAEAPEAEAPEAAATEAETQDTAAEDTAAAAGTAADEPDTDPAPITPREAGALRNFLGYEFPTAPDTPTGPIDQAAVDILEVIWAGLELGGFDGGLVAGLGNTEDPPPGLDPVRPAPVLLLRRHPRRRRLGLPAPDRGETERRPRG